MATNRKFEYQKKEQDQQANLRLILFTILFLSLLNGLFAQSVVKRNNLGQFEHITPARDSVSYAPTKEIFVDSKGEKYTVYQTKNGKYFVLRTSKKTGKKYREYLRLLN